MSTMLAKEKSRVVVGGKKFVLDPAELCIERNDADLKVGAAKLVNLLRLRAEARKELQEAEADFAQWKAQTTRKALPLALPDWKTRNRVETEPGYRERQQQVIECNRTAAICDAFVQALQAKIDLMRTGRADRRFEMDTARYIDPVDDGHPALDQHGK